MFKSGPVYIPGSLFNSLTSFLPGRSYWVYLTAPVTLVIPGGMLSDATSTFDAGAGWVQVAYWRADGAAPADAFFCMDGLYDVIVDGAGRVYIPGSLFNSLSQIHRSGGYFLHLTGGAVIRYNCP